MGVSAKVDLGRVELSHPGSGGIAGRCSPSAARADRTVTRTHSTAPFFYDEYSTYIWSFHILGSCREHIFVFARDPGDIDHARLVPVRGIKLSVSYLGDQPTSPNFRHHDIATSSIVNRPTKVQATFVPFSIARPCGDWHDGVYMCTRTSGVLESPCRALKVLESSNPSR